ncbi:MAG: hypothetical protein H7Z77_08730 [Chitinophagaceae bacterium]|nr:hypothetical protein [Polaromonas sp.]
MANMLDVLVKRRQQNKSAVHSLAPFAAKNRLLKHLIANHDHGHDPATSARDSIR